MSDLWAAFWLGVVEGLTEFLPVSSTGHLLLAQHWIGLDLQEGFWKLFAIVIQVGAILAVIVYYSPTLLRLLTSFAKGRTDRPRYAHPLLLVGLATLPAVALGLPLARHIDELMEYALPIGIALIVGAGLMWWVERHTKGWATTESVDHVTARQALLVGLAQCFAMIPGMSRSACTIMGALLCRMSIRAAADFSFLLSIPTICGAALLSLLRYREPISAHQWSVLAVGFAVSFVVALLVIHWFLGWLKAHGLGIFVIYRLLLGGLVITLWSIGQIN